MLLAMSQSSKHATKKSTLKKILFLLFTNLHFFPYLQKNNPATSENDEEELITALIKMKSLIVQNSSTALREPDLYFNQKPNEQVDEILSKYSDMPFGITSWLEDTCADIIEEGAQHVVQDFIGKIVANLHNTVKEIPFVVMSDSHVLKVQYFIRTPKLAKFFILANYPKMEQSGRAFMETLLGSILTKSCLPLTEMGTYDFFEEPSKQPPSVHNNTEGRIWSATEIVHEICHEIFNALFRVDPEVKHLTLMWIGNCFQANAGRGKMWTNEMGPWLSNTFASDGFMLNLEAVLLMFCKPFAEGVGNTRMLKIDPTYTSVESAVSEDAKAKNVHLREAQKETFLVPSETEDKEKEDVPESFNFITDIFFLTHKSLDLGFRVCHEKLVKMNQELGRQQQMYRELMSSGQGSSPAGEVIQKKMDALMTRYMITRIFCNF